MNITIDLHMHSTASDGTKTPAQLIDLALEYGKKHPGKIYMALTDHDTVAGIPEFLEYAAQYPDQIQAYAGIEISTYYKDESIHILGYGVDVHNEAFLSALENYRDNRDRRNIRILQKLNEHGIPITLEDLPVSEDGSSIGRPIIAQYLLTHNYVSSIKEAFKKYLGKGKCCYVPREKPDMRTAIELITSSGGVAVLAHPIQYQKLTSDDILEMLTSMREMGLTGLEVYYSKNRPEDIECHKALADSLGLFATGGSDYHGEVKPDISLFTGRGDLHVPEEILKDARNPFNEM